MPFLLSSLVQGPGHAQWGIQTSRFSVPLAHPFRTSKGLFMRPPLLLPHDRFVTWIIGKSNHSVDLHHHCLGDSEPTCILGQIAPKVDQTRKSINHHWPDGKSITGIIGKPQLLYNSHACSSSVLAVTELRLMREKLSTESLSNQDLAKRVDSDSVKLSPMSTHFGSYGICHSTPSNPQSLISSKPCVTPADCLQSSAPSKLLYCCSWGPIQCRTPTILW